MCRWSCPDSVENVDVFLRNSSIGLAQKLRVKSAPTWRPLQREILRKAPEEPPNGPSGEIASSITVLKLSGFPRFYWKKALQSKLDRQQHFSIQRSKNEKKKNLSARTDFGLNKSPQCYKYKYIHTVHTNIHGYSFQCTAWEQIMYISLNIITLFANFSVALVKYCE